MSDKVYTKQSLVDLVWAALKDGDQERAELASLVIMGWEQADRLHDTLVALAGRVHRALVLLEIAPDSLAGKSLRSLDEFARGVMGEPIAEKLHRMHFDELTGGAFEFEASHWAVYAIIESLGASLANGESHWNHLTMTCEHPEAGVIDVIVQRRAGVSVVADLHNLKKRVAELEKAQERHLQLIADLTRAEPLPGEAEEAKQRAAALIAEVGTLRARVRELQDERKAQEK